MARTTDTLRRLQLLDQVVNHLAEHGLAGATLRPMAADLGVSINRLVHHFGSKDDLIAAALARNIERQIAVQGRWLRANPDITQVELYRKWWRWINQSPANLALVRLNYEAAALDPVVSGLTGAVRADQIGVWRHDVERRLVSEGLSKAEAAIEAALIKSAFSGLVMDLLATGDQRRLTRTLDEWLNRVSDQLELLASPPREGGERR